MSSRLTAVWVGSSEGLDRKPFDFNFENYVGMRMSVGTMSGVNIVWLKKDVRLHDHAPLWHAVQDASPFILLWAYEPEMLSHETVHGSHICFANEGLKNLEHNLALHLGYGASDDAPRFITCVYGEIVSKLRDIHKVLRIKTIFAHEETGHLVSFDRDKRVRAWAKSHSISFREYCQSGVKRGLKDRDRFTHHLNAFLASPQIPLPSGPAIARLLVKDYPSCGILPLSEIKDLAPKHRHDRPERQRGGESLALATLTSFLNSRGKMYSLHISSPNSSWTSGSRLSAFLTCGHISLRRVFQALQRRQRELRALKKGKSDFWLRSLAGFASRLRWRVHFQQKLEMEPEMERHAQCRAFDSFRCRDGDLRPDFLEAWAKGRTGYPMVDASMRCLLRTGWVNFRMRAMLVSFGAWNLFLDWRVMESYLARAFLDFEPGIHYPQLQMQSGATGINALRVYNPIKQGQDQDKNGIFIKKFCSELKNVPPRYIHEPHKMPRALQQRISCLIGVDYPNPIVDASESARVSKALYTAIKKRKETRLQANKVLLRHGSRRGQNDRKRGGFRSSSPVRPDQPGERGQKSVRKMLENMAGKSAVKCSRLNLALLASTDAGKRQGKQKRKRPGSRGRESGESLLKFFKPAS